MIVARGAEPTEIARWDEIVVHCGGNGMHLPAVHRVEADADALRPLVFERGEQVVGCALALSIEQRRLKGLLRGPRLLQLPTAPALVDAADAPQVRSALFEHARATGHTRLIVLPTYSDWLAGDPDLASFRTGSIVEFVIDLRPGQEAVEAAMAKQHRKNVRRALRAGIEVEQDDSYDGLLALRAMQLSSSARAAERAEGFGVRDESFFERLHREVYAPGHGHVIFARLEGERIAALAWIEGGRKVLTVRSGSVPEGYRTRAMYVLYDELVRRSIADGMVELNAGGVPAEAADAEHPQAGLYEFKAGFGGMPVPRYTLDVALEEVVA